MYVHCTYICTLVKVKGWFFLTDFLKNIYKSMVFRIIGKIRFQCQIIRVNNFDQMSYMMKYGGQGHFNVIRVHQCHLNF